MSSTNLLPHVHSDKAFLNRPFSTKKGQFDIFIYIYIFVFLGSLGGSLPKQLLCTLSFELAQKAIAMGDEARPPLVEIFENDICSHGATLGKDACVCNECAQKVRQHETSACDGPGSHEN